MIQSIARAATIYALCLALGWHWAAVQTVAWATMIVQYSQHASLAKAVAQTFDGEHPCALCKHISAAQHAQKENKTQPATTKLDLICATRASTPPPRASDFSFVRLETRASQRAKSPPTPPPRSGLA